MKVLEIKGYKSLHVLNAFNALMLGLKMLPEYMAESYEDFFDRVSGMPEVDQKKLIREAAHFVTLEKEELEAILSFVADPNGVPYSAANVANLGPKEILEAVVAVCCEVAKIKIDFVTDDEKKK